MVERRSGSISGSEYGGFEHLLCRCEPGAHSRQVKTMKRRQGGALRRVAVPGKLGRGSGVLLADGHDGVFYVGRGDGASGRSWSVINAMLTVRRASVWLCRWR